MPNQENQENLETRQIENYYPFILPVNVLPMFFHWDLKAKTLVAKIRVYWDDADFNNYAESSILLDDDAAFAGSIYDGFIAQETVAPVLGLMEQQAVTVAKFQANDVLTEIKIDSNLRLIEVKGERILAENAVDLLGDPSQTFSDAQNKFEKFKTANPQLVQMYYGLVLGIFAQKESPKQPFYQKVMAQVMAQVMAGQEG